MLITRLLREHAKLRVLGGDLVSIVASPEPCDLGELARCRWELARAVHLHLAYEERALFFRLESDPRPKVCAASAKAKRAVEQLHLGYTEHVELWGTNEVVRRWPEFQAAVGALVKRMIAELDNEERDLFPLLAHEQNVDPRWLPGMRNWAGDGIALQAFIKRSAAQPGDPSEPGRGGHQPDRRT